MFLIVMDNILCLGRDPSLLLPLPRNSTSSLLSCLFCDTYYFLNDFISTYMHNYDKLPMASPFALQVYLCSTNA